MSNTEIMILILIKSLIVWILMTYILSSLLILILRCLYYSPQRHKILEPSIDEVDTNRISNILLYVAILVVISIFCGLYLIYNIGITLAAAMFMFSRTPGYIFEISSGVDIGSGIMPNKPIYIFAKIILWLVLPVIVLSFYHLKYKLF
jgi:hypothetical protein